MEYYIELLNANIEYALIILIAFTVILLFMVIWCLVKISKLNKRLNAPKLSNEESIIESLSSFESKSEEINSKYDRIIEALIDMNDNIDKCIQKVGIIRYNPFAETGGNLCYAVALLDSENNGVVLNGIHSRSGCFTYAKPIEMGISEYTLSDEENKALSQAMGNSYTSDERDALLKEIKEQYKEEILTSKAEKSKKRRKTASSKIKENNEMNKSFNF